MKYYFLLPFLLVLLPCGAAQFLTPNTNPAPATVTLAWSPSADPTVTGYYLYQGTSSGQYTVKSNALAANSITMTLAFGQTYFFAATAYNAGGLESLFSSEVSYRPIQSATNTPPSSPPGLKPVVVLSVEYKNDLQDFQWVSLLNFGPTNGQWFRLQAQAAPPSAILNRNPLIRALPPPAPH